MGSALTAVIFMMVVFLVLKWGYGKSQKMLNNIGACHWRMPHPFALSLSLCKRMHWQPLVWYPLWAGLTRGATKKLVHTIGHDRIAPSRGSRLVCRMRYLLSRFVKQEPGPTGFPRVFWAYYWHARKRICLHFDRLSANGHGWMNGFAQANGYERMNGYERVNGY